MNPYSIYVGDNVKQMREHLLDSVIDLTVTSPPYDSLRDYKGHSWNFDDLLIELTRVTCDGGIVMWNVADQTVNGSESGSSFRQALKFIDAGWRWYRTSQLTT